MNRYDYKYYKIVLCGEFGAGKTSLINRYITGNFDHFCSSTIGASFQEKVITNEKIRLGIWDTAGQERYNSLLPMYYRGADLVIYCISWDTPFDEVIIINFLKDMRKYNQTAKIFFVVTKRDLCPDKIPFYSELERFCIPLEHSVFYTSSLKNIGIDKVFDEVIDHLKHCESQQKVGVELQMDKRLGCCWL